jgi:hypothetical protein
MCNLHMVFYFLSPVHHLHTGFHLSLGLCVCTLGLFVLVLGVGVVEIVCLSNRWDAMRDACFVYSVLFEPLALQRLHLL